VNKLIKITFTVKPGHPTDSTEDTQYSTMNYVTMATQTDPVLPINAEQQKQVNFLVIFIQSKNSKFTSHFRNRSNFEKSNGGKVISAIDLPKCIFLLCLCASIALTSVICNQNFNFGTHRTNFQTFYFSWTSFLRLFVG